MYILTNRLLNERLSSAASLIVAKFENIYYNKPEAVFLVVCDPSMNELWAT